MHRQTNRKPAQTTVPNLRENPLPLLIAAAGVSVEAEKPKNLLHLKVTQE